VAVPLFILRYASVCKLGLRSIYHAIVCIIGPNCLSPDKLNVLGGPLHSAI